MEQFRKGMVTRNMKKIVSVLCLIACLFGLSGCGILAEKKPVDPDTAKQLEATAQLVIENAFNYLDEASAEDLTSQGAEAMEVVFSNSFNLKVAGQGMVEAFGSWNSALKEIGEYQKITGYSASYNSKGNGIIVIAYIEGTKRTAQVEFVFDDDLYHTIESCATNVEYTFGEKMEKAALNTLLGMGTVFVVLLLLCLIISCFSFIPKIQASLAKKNAPEVKESAVNNTIAQIVEKEELVDDLELVAVITAAIAASGTSGASAGADGFVVRSIKRVPTNKWNRA